jgi:6-phosphogluconolactonase
VLLGIGADGHLASLFPGHPGLDDPGPIVAVSDAPKPPPERLSLSLPVLERVSVAVLVVTGEDKGAVLARAERERLPIGRYTPAGTCHWVLDPAAARGWERT